MPLPPLPTITSPQNEKIKLVRALQGGSKARRREGRIALEGLRLIADALATGATPDFCLYTPDAAEADRPTAPLLANLAGRGVLCYPVLPALFAEAADTQTPQGLIAVLPPPELPFPPAPTFLLILDGVADPGNLGTILRTATAAGTQGVVLAPGCVDPYNPKALRAGMGAHFRVPVAALTWPEIGLRFGGLPFYLADSEGGTAYDQIAWRGPFALIIGGEARGANAAGRSAATAIATIPMANNAESLNAAAAAAVILFEAARQRRRET